MAPCADGQVFWGKRRKWMARVWEGWGVEGRMAAMREVHGEVVQRAWSANLRDRAYRRKPHGGVVLSTDAASS